MNEMLILCTMAKKTYWYFIPLQNVHTASEVLQRALFLADFPVHQLNSQPEVVGLCRYTAHITQPYTHAGEEGQSGEIARWIPRDLDVGREKNARQMGL